MDAQDQPKTSPTGHGVHLCSKCGWPFPKQHPSAKHRRAHKKVCGKVEGYVMNVSLSASDEDHSDDNMRTPSPKLDKENIKEPVSSGGSGSDLLRSYKSEDELFSDAVTEFSESGYSPSPRESMDRVKQLGNNVGKELEIDLLDVQQTKDEEHIDVKKVFDESIRGSEEAVGNTTSPSESIKPGTDIRNQEVSVGVDLIDGEPINSPENGNSYKAKEEVSVGADQIDGEPISSPDIASENGNSDKAKELISSEPDTFVEKKRSVTELECPPGNDDSVSDSAAEKPKLETRPDELEKQSYEHVESNNVAPELDRKTSATVILDTELHEADLNTLHSSAVDEATGQENKLSTVSETGTVVIGHVLDKVDNTEQDQTSTLQADKSEYNLSSQIFPPKDADVSSTRQVEVDPTEDSDHVKLTEDNEIKVEGCIEVLSVPVSESSPVIEKSKIMIEDFKDDEVLTSSFPLNSENGEVARPVDIDEKVVAEPVPSSFSSLTSSQPDLSTTINLQKGAVESVGEENDTSTLQMISEDGTRTNGTESYHNTLNHFPEVNLEASQGLNELESIGTLAAGSEFCPEDNGIASEKQLEDSKDTEAQRSISFIGDGSELNLVDQDEVTKKNSEDYKEPTASEKIPAVVEDMLIEDSIESELLMHKAENKLTVENLSVSAVDDSAISCSRTESLEGNWGSVLSTQSDGTTQTDAEPLDKSEGTLLKPQTTSDAYRPEKSDVFEPPSFMTLVNPRSENEKTIEASEITETSKSEAVDAGWIPSLTNVVNESEGRKKNEEIIAKVTNWSPGKQHSPLKTLLNEAHAETKAETATEEKQLPPKDHTDETASKNNGAGVATVSSIMGAETPVHDAAKREMDKEWNSPARYPTVIKKEKKKGKPYWVPFVCCTSAQRDM